MELQDSAGLKPLEIMCEKGYALSPSLLHHLYGWNWKAELSGSQGLVLPVLLMFTFRTSRTEMTKALEKVCLELSTIATVVQVLFKHPSGEGSIYCTVRSRFIQVRSSAKFSLTWFTESRSRTCFAFIFLLIGVR